jgi:hypothetical protein
MILYRCCRHCGHTYRARIRHEMPCADAFCQKGRIPHTAKWATGR